MNTEIQNIERELIYFTLPESGLKIDLIFDEEMFWFTQKTISTLFDVTVANVNVHIKKIFQMPEFQHNRTIKFYLIVQKEGERDVRRRVKFYCLDAVIAVGFRVNSQRANRFKQWAIKTLREYIINFGKTPTLQLPAIDEPYSRYVQLFDAEIFCEVSGRKDAPVLVFLHGNGEDLNIFNPQIRYLSQYYSIVAIDTRAHGQSPRGTEPLNFYTFANDLICVLDALKIDKAHIVGFSDGAITALHAALTAPERILSMVLLGANYNRKGIKLLPRLQIQMMYVWLSLVSLFSQKMRNRKEIWGLMVCQPNLTIEEISRITTPTLVITGEKDLVCQRHNDELSRAIEGSKRMIIKDGCHFWMFKQPEVLNNLVIEFCSY